LANEGKTCWFDCHRRFLPTDHAFWRNKNFFKKRKVERDEPPHILPPTQVWHNIRDLPKVTETATTKYTWIWGMTPLDKKKYLLGSSLLEI